MAFQLRWVVLVAPLCSPAMASTNGLLYACDSNKLASEKLCYFTTTGDPVSTHSIDRNVADDTFRKVVDADGKDLSVSPKPWTQGDHLAASADNLTGNLLGYSLAFELVAPLRDAMMYAPKTLVDDTTLWTKLTKVFVDCKVKETEEVGHGPEPGKSVDTIYTYLGDAASHHPVLQFLEEAAIDLVCLMTGLNMNRCADARPRVGMVDSTEEGTEIVTSTCWQAAYSELYDVTTSPTIEGATVTSSGPSLVDAASGTAGALWALAVPLLLHCFGGIRS